jgi:putative DNA primase/helicase
MPAGANREAAAVREPPIYEANPERRRRAEQEREKHRRSTEEIGHVCIEHGNEVNMEKIEWLWPGWLARGKFHLLAGSKGAGKSTILFDLIARLTAGSVWPDKSPVSTHGDVMIWSGEDGIKDTVLPRFYAAGGDLSRIHFPVSTIVYGEKRPFDPSTDIEGPITAAEAMPELLLVGICQAAPTAIKIPRPAAACSRSSISPSTAASPLPGLPTSRKEPRIATRSSA